MAWGYLDSHPGLKSKSPILIQPFEDCRTSPLSCGEDMTTDTYFQGCTLFG